MKKIFLISFMTSTLFLSTPLKAIEEADSLFTLNFYQALEFAISHDQDLQSAEYQYQSTLTTRRQSKAALLPQLSLSVFARESDQETKNSSQPGLIPNTSQSFGTTGYSLNLNQTLYNHSLYKNLQRTDKIIAGAFATVEAARQDLIVRLANAYFNVLGAEDNLKFASAEKKAIGKQLEQSQKRFEVGLIAITDVKEAQASYDTSVAQEIDAETLLSAQVEALAVILGIYTPHIAPMAEDISLSMPQPASIQKWSDNAQQNNLSLKAAQFNFQAAQKQVDADQSGHYPYLDLNAGYNYSSPDGGRIFSDQTDTTISIQLTVPIYSGGFTSAKHSQSVALKEQARSQKEKAKRQAVQQTRDAYLGVTSSISQVKAFKQALISNQSAHEATQAGFEVGTRTAIDVLSTLREVYAAERDYARARYNYVINTLRLKQAAGSLTIADASHVNDFLLPAKTSN